MDTYGESGPTLRLLPGVDLALWLRIVVAVLLVALVAGVAALAG